VRNEKRDPVGEAKGSRPVVPHAPTHRFRHPFSSCGLHLVEEFRPDSSKRPAPGEYEIVFGIVSRSATRDTIPFFSRVNLRRVTQTLRAMGYTVTLALITDATPPAPAKGPNAKAATIPKPPKTVKIKTPLPLPAPIPKAP
jgi:hypothetical protein